MTFLTWLQPGTEKQHVADDYAKRLAIGTSSCENVFSTILGHLIAPSKPPTFSFCPLLNISICPSTTDDFSQGKTLAVVVYNPIAWKRLDYVRLVVPTASVQGDSDSPVLIFLVLDSSGVPVAAQVFKNADNEDLFTLVFPVDLPPAGFVTFFLQNSQVLLVCCSLTGMLRVPKPSDLKKFQWKMLIRWSRTIMWESPFLVLHVIRSLIRYNRRYWSDEFYFQQSNWENSASGSGNDDSFELILAEYAVVECKRR